MSHTVKRRDYVKRSRVTLNCDTCGFITTHCAIEDADIYEAGYTEHVCRIGDMGDRPAFLRMLAHMAGGAS